MTNYDQLFQTLCFGLFGSNVDTRDIEIYCWIYCVNFLNMSNFDYFSAVLVLLRKCVLSQNKSFIDKGGILTCLIGYQISSTTFIYNFMKD